MRNKIIFAMLFIGILFISGCANTSDTKSDKQIANAKCGIENCHGLDITCGKNAPEICTAMYRLGDFCRQYAKCEIINGQCQLAGNKEFNKCKECVEKCEKFEAQDSFECESECRKLFE